MEEPISTEETSPEEVVQDLNQLLAVEEKSAKIKLEMLNTYSVQEVSPESTVEDTKTFITERVSIIRVYLFCFVQYITVGPYRTV